MTNQEFKTLEAGNQFSSNYFGRTIVWEVVRSEGKLIFALPINHIGIPAGFSLQEASKLTLIS